MMHPAFRFVALPYQQFGALFAQDDVDLQAAGARRLVVEEKPGTPCRVSLVDAEIGETVLALPFTHHDVISPYRASGPIFVREAAVRAEPATNEVPTMFRHRLLSVRGYDATAMMIAAEVVGGEDLETTLHGMFGQERVRYVHLHNARPGCFNCAVVRA